MTLQHIGYLLLEVITLKWGQKTEGPQIEGHHRWHGLLEQLWGIQQGAIATQADNEVNAIGKVISTISVRINMSYNLLHNVADFEVTHLKVTNFSRSAKKRVRTPV